MHSVGACGAKHSCLAGQTGISCFKVQEILNCIYPEGVISRSPGPRAQRAHPVRASPQGVRRSLSINVMATMIEPLWGTCAFAILTQGALAALATLGFEMQPLRGKYDAFFFYRLNLLQMVWPHDG